MLKYRHMSQQDIICKATVDTFVRFGIVLVAIFGFSLYFFYDGAIGYQRKNEVIYSYKAFADLGAAAIKETDSSAWRQRLEGKPLFRTSVREDGSLAVQSGDAFYPLPEDCPVAKSCPEEVLDLEKMKSWADCWQAYSGRMGLPVKPGEHPYDEGAIREQWCMGILGMLLVAVGLYFVIRTYGRELSLRGDTVTAAGRQFRIADIESIDLRQWGTGFKGVAYFTVKGRKIKVDGMTYGGFNKEKGEPAEAFMQALLAQYKGDIIEYEKADTASKS